jgi:hypothetical protein
MKIWTKILYLILLSIIDYVIIWLWVKQIDPDPSVSIGIFLLIPLVLLINWVVALILYFTIKKFAILFLFNSFIAGFLMFYLFGKGIDRRQNERLESWSFKSQNTIFTITHWKKENTFSKSESTNLGSSTEFLYGKFTKKENKYYLSSETKEFFIKNDFLYGFRSPLDIIKLTKILR